MTDIDDDLLAVVPTGTTVLEASAGTGKTHVLASIATRAVAAGLPLDALLLVTFTRMATGELRDRVRGRLVRAEHIVRQHLEAGTAVPQDPDDETRAICDATATEVGTRHRRLRDAIADFDAITIATIHGFCQQVLSQVGFAGDVDRDVDFLEDPRGLVEEVVDDLLVQKMSAAGPAGFRRSTAMEIARLVVENPDALILPPAAEERDRPDQERLRFAHRVRQLVETRKRERRLLGYDDLLTRLADTLAGPNGDVVRGRLAERFALVAVDEFQDTDAIQWKILDAAFGDPDTRLVLIGDPKQAIYSFRGADVHAYLEARHRAAERGRVDTLAVNWRSDADLLRGLDAVFGTAALGHPEIAYQPTVAAPHHRMPRLVGGQRATPVRIRVLRRDQHGAQLTATAGTVRPDWARAHIADDIASDVVRRLDDGSMLVDRDRDGNEQHRPVEPGDIAVLVPRNRDAELVRDALVAVGVPAVLNGAGTVFDSEAAQDWIALLEAMELPASSPRVHTVAMTPFVGWPAETVADPDTSWDGLHADLHRWRLVLEDHGVAACFEHLTATSGLSARVLARVDGPRRLTDLRHIAQLAHGHATEHGHAVASLLAWLREQVAGADEDPGLDERSRRLETDAAAVQVWTVHRSKGLEFPIVYVPFLWSPGYIPKDATPVFHAGPDNARYIDVGGRRPGWRDHHDLSVAERRGEELRLAYVAATRARHQVVLWWAPTKDAAASPLARLCFAPRSPIALKATPADDGARTALDMLATDAGGAVAIEPSTGGDGRRWVAPSGPDQDLAVRRFDRIIDRTWGRTSYSGLVAAAHAGAPAPTHDHEARGLDDERHDEDSVAANEVAGTVDATTEARLRAVLSPFGDLGGGARFGTFVHAVLEDVDFTEPDLTAAIRAEVDARSAGTDLDRTALVAGLVAAVRTPLGPIADEMSMDTLPRSARLDEMHFELPVAGGDRPRGTVSMAALAALVDRFAGDDALVTSWLPHLSDPALDRRFRGFLSGAIDVVAEIDDSYLVIDHKSNWLGVDGEPLSAWHYRPDALRAAMVRAHYPLQALLYLVATHRFLRWRLRDYDPDAHLRGAAYLFLRGMTGPDNPTVDGQPCGVMGWRPPTALITELSDLLEHGDG